MKRMIVKYTWFLGCALLISGVATAEEASLRWARSTTLSSITSGVVSELKVRPGQTVKKGQLLLQLQPEIFSSRLHAAEMQLTQARAFMQEAKSEYKRSKEMYDNSMLSDHELEVKRLAVLQAEAEYSQTQSEQARARFLQQQSAVVAPFDAIVTNIYVAESESINGEFKTIPLMELVSSNTVSAVSKLSFSKAMSLSPGQQLMVDVNGKAYTGVLSKIVLGQTEAGSSSINSDVLIEVDLPLAPGNKVYPGVSATLKLP